MHQTKTYMPTVHHARHMLRLFKKGEATREMMLDVLQDCQVAYSLTRFARVARLLHVEMEIIEEALS